MGTEEEPNAEAVQQAPAVSDDRISGTMPGITVTPEIPDSQDMQHKPPAPSPEQPGSSAPDKHEGKEGKATVSSKASDSKRRRRAKQRNPEKARIQDLENSTDDSTSENEVKPGQSKSRRKSRKGLTKHTEKRQTKVDDDSSSSSDEGTLTKEQSSIVSKNLANIKSEVKTQLSRIVDELNIDCVSTSTDTAAQPEKLLKSVSQPTTEGSLAHLTFSPSFVEQALTILIANTRNEAADDDTDETTTDDPSTSTEKAEKGSKPGFMRLDHVWDDHARRFKSKPSSKEDNVDKYSSYAFNAVRHFHYKGEYTYTQLNIISTALKKVMMEVMGQVQGISLEEDPAKLNPDDVFLYLDELRTCSKKLKTEIKSMRRKSKIQQLKTARTHLKVLLKYLDEDYAETKKSLYPLLASRKITFDLVWALFKSNEIVYTSTYDVQEHPRAVKVTYVSQVSSNHLEPFLVCSF